MHEMAGAMRAIAKPESSLGHIHALAVVVHCQHRTCRLVTNKTRFPHGVVAFLACVFIFERRLFSGTVLDELAVGNLPRRLVNALDAQWSNEALFVDHANVFAFNEADKQGRHQRGITT